MHPHSCRKFRFFIPLFVLAFLAVLTLVVRGLWNGVLVDVLTVKAITYWQALGLLLLTRILFGGWPGGRRCGGHWRERMMNKHWESLDPEQRTKLREEMRQRFGDWPRPPWCGPESGSTDLPPKPPGNPS
jgi:hypothetical protein